MPIRRRAVGAADPSARRAIVKVLYEPMPKQRIFHNAPAKYRCYVGGFGAGKTLCGAAEAIQLSIEYKCNTGLVGRMTYPELRDTTRKEVLEFPIMVDDKQTTLVNSPLVKSFNKAENTLYFNNGSQIIFRSLEDSFDKIKSLNLGWFWIDEATEANEEIWLGLVGRLRKPGTRRCGFVTTNPEGHDWVWKKWVAQPTEQHFLVTAPSTENVHLPKDYIPNLVQSYPEEWVKRYIYGSMETFEGLVYKQFADKAPWVIDGFDIPDNWYRFVALDHGYRNPTAVLWFAVDPKGNVFVYDEFYASGKLVSEIAEIIKGKTGKDKVQLYLIDPSCKNRNGITGRSVIDEFADNGVYFEPANNDVRAGINHVQEGFKLRGNSKPRLVIFRNCAKLRTELQTYRWKDIKAGAKVDSPEKPLKKEDHAVDALRYGTIYVFSTPELKVERKNYFDYKEALKRIAVEESWMAA